MKISLFGIELSFDLYKPGCTGKIKYGHFISAQRAADTINAKPTTRRKLEPYRCSYCKKYHIGGVS